MVDSEEKQGKLSINFGIKMAQATLGIVWHQDKQAVALVKRRDIPLWVLPGGGVDRGEKPEEAVIREVWEETGLQVAVECQIAQYLPINRLAVPTSLFSCKVVGGELCHCPKETADVGFFHLDSFPASFFFLHKSWFDEARNCKGGMICRHLHEVNYRNLLRYVLRHPFWVARFALTRLKQ